MTDKRTGGAKRPPREDPRSDLVLGRRGALEAVRSGRAAEILVASGARETQGLREVLEAAEQAGVPVQRVPRERLDALAPEHRGVAARLGAAAPAAMDERDLSDVEFDENATVVVLDGVTDPQNLGACARTAEAAGAALLVTRIKRAAGVTPAAVRASAGALLHLPLARVANIGQAIVRLQTAGFFVVGLDASAVGSVYERPRPPGRLALVVGDEGEGLSRLVRERCDELVSLPMTGQVASLNVSAALAAALYAYVLPPAARLPLD